MASLSQYYSLIDVAIRQFERGQIVQTGQIVQVSIPIEMTRYLVRDARQGTIVVHMSDIVNGTRAATHLRVTRAATHLRVTRAASYMSMCLSALQLPESTHSDIVARVSRVARAMIMSSHVRGSGMSMEVTIQATTMDRPIEYEYEDEDDVGEFDEFTDGIGIYDTIDQFGAVPATQSSIETLEKVRHEAPESESNTQTQCSICLEEFEAGSEVTRLPCLHVYHGDCIVQWLQKSHLCPLCRFSLPHTS